ncbi:hypothetical protein BY996DRAFT_6420599 [Phakopsora pachyrhizi]|nr:hypothetical protein BY996DRAFT_6420599 [Phakopsora pachyrhizi]
MSPKALIAGFEGHGCETVETHLIPRIYKSVVESKSINLEIELDKYGKRQSTFFDIEKDMVRLWDQVHPQHPNGTDSTKQQFFYISIDKIWLMSTFSTALQDLNKMLFSVHNEQGDLIVMDDSIKQDACSERETLPGRLGVKRKARNLYQRLHRGFFPPLSNVSSKQPPSLLFTKPNLLSSGQTNYLINLNDINENLTRDLNVTIQNCGQFHSPLVIRGQSDHGIPPIIPRRTSLHSMDFLSCYAIAILSLSIKNNFEPLKSEVIALGGRIVTAPTNGAAGSQAYMDLTVPSVLIYFLEFISEDLEQNAMAFLLTAAAIRMLYKRGATIDNCLALLPPNFVRGAVKILLEIIGAKGKTLPEQPSHGSVFTALGTLMGAANTSLDRMAGINSLTGDGYILTYPPISGGRPSASLDKICGTSLVDVGFPRLLRQFLFNALGTRSPQEIKQTSSSHFKCDNSQMTPKAQEKLSPILGPNPFVPDKIRARIMTALGELRDPIWSHFLKQSMESTYLYEGLAWDIKAAFKAFKNNLCISFDNKAFDSILSLTDQITRTFTESIDSMFEALLQRNTRALFELIIKLLQDGSIPSRLALALLVAEAILVHRRNKPAFEIPNAQLTPKDSEENVVDVSDEKRNITDEPMVKGGIFMGLHDIFLNFAYPMNSFNNHFTASTSRPNKKEN